MMARFIRSKWSSNITLALILALALFLRLRGLQWDGGFLFHPDERQLLIVADKLSFPWPPDWSLLLSPKSPWNPKFFAYGSLPIYLLRACASLAGHYNPDLASLESSYIVGRVLSALFDVGTVFLVYHLGRKLHNRATGLVAASLMCLTVLHIQLAHFFTVDSLLAFFVVLVVLLSVDVVRQPRIWQGLLLGFVFGMALATKVSAAPLLVPIVLAWLFGGPGQESGRRWLLAWGRALLGLFLTGIAALVAFLFYEPYALIDVVSFLIDVFQESYMARGLADIPYTRQFIGTLPYIYPLWQAIVWSMGFPLGIAGFTAAAAALVRAVVTLVQGQWRRAGELLVPIAWVAPYFGMTGSFHAKFLRYMLPVIPFLCLWAAWALVSLASSQGAWRRLRRALGVVGLVIVLLGTGAYAAAYMHIYDQPHTWIQATAWLCENLPPHSKLVIEHWDDPLPLLQATGYLHCHEHHDVTTLAVYNPDDTRKLASLLDALEQNDYIILSSNRLYNTIPRLPKRYPLTSRYYELLMGERLGFELVYYAAVYPQVFGISLVDDTFSDPRLPVPRLIAQKEALRRAINLGRADESFTVYDHPKPLVFRKTQQLARAELLELLGDAARGLPEPKPKAAE
jgi:hypothetical protein